MKIQKTDQIAEAPTGYRESPPSEQRGAALDKPFRRTRQTIAATIKDQPLSPEQVAI
jgi:hypothetical protein